MRHQGLRRRMIEKLRDFQFEYQNQTTKIDQQVLIAMGKVPRHLFAPTGLEHLAYKSKTTLGIGDKQTISAPQTVALQSHLLQIKRGEKILEIGTGSGYQAAVLYELGAEVYSIERIKNLYHRSSQLLKSLYPRIYTKLGDGFEGWETKAPFDKIVLTCATPEVPIKLIGQLKINGFVIAPVGEPINEAGISKQILKKFIRSSETGYQVTSITTARFVPMLKGVK